MVLTCLVGLPQNSRLVIENYPKELEAGNLPTERFDGLKPGVQGGVREPEKAFRRIQVSLS